VALRKFLALSAGLAGPAAIPEASVESAAQLLVLREELQGRAGDRDLLGAAAQGRVDRRKRQPVGGRGVGGEGRQRGRPQAPGQARGFGGEIAAGSGGDEPRAGVGLPAQRLQAGVVPRQGFGGEGQVTALSLRAAQQQILVGRVQGGGCPQGPEGRGLLRREVRAQVGAACPQEPGLGVAGKSARGPLQGAGRVCEQQVDGRAARQQSRTGTGQGRATEAHLGPVDPPVGARAADRRPRVRPRAPGAWPGCRRRARASAGDRRGLGQDRAGSRGPPAVSMAAASASLPPSRSGAARAPRATPRSSSPEPDTA
jgi:hypothetical protein